jgi:hypothetical protein
MKVEHLRVILDKLTSEMPLSTTVLRLSNHDIKGLTVTYNFGADNFMGIGTVSWR